MAPKKPSRDDALSFFSRLYERSEEALSQVVQELLRNKGVRDRLGKTVGQAVHAKRRVDRNIQILLSLLNVPSRADYDRLLHKVEALQGSLVNLNMKLDRLLAAAAERQASRRRPQRAARVERGHPKPSA